MLNTCERAIKVNARAFPSSSIESSSNEMKRVDSVPTVTVQDRTESLVSCLILICKQHKMKPAVVKQLRDQVSEYLNETTSETAWLKRSKDLLTYPKAKFLKNILPEIPDRRFEPSGILKKWMKNRLSVYSPKNIHLWYSWLQSKRGALPSSDEMISSTYEKHLQTLTKPDDGCEATIDRILANPVLTRVMDKVKSWIDKIEWDKVHKTFPSMSACFTHSRSMGGQLGSLCDQVGLGTKELVDFVGDKLINLDEHRVSDVAKTPELLWMKWYPHSYKQAGPYLHSCYEVPGRDEWNTLDVSRVRGRVHHHLAHSAMSSIIEGVSPLGTPESFWSEGQGPLSCTIQAILEPMKVRVISKGESLPYYFMKPLQEAMHNCLREIPCFRLIGRPFSGSDLIDLKRLASPGDKWFSIDYSAATDNLSWKYSGKIFEYLIKDMPWIYKETALKVLGPHMMYYPKLVKGEWKAPSRRDKAHLMQRGQLMGSILSFPILCLANLGLFLEVNDVRLDGWSDKDILESVLINGDDMLYCAPEYFWEKHIEIGRKVGLEMSLGKAYIHTKYSNINSVACTFDLEDPKSSPRRIDFFNVGLFRGQHKVQEGKGCGEKTDKSNSYVASIPDVLRGSLEPARTLSQYLTAHRDMIKDECAAFIHYEDEKGRLKKRYHVRNLFLPCAQGGMGITPPPTFKFKVSMMDKRLAYHLTRDIPYTSQLPLPGPSIEIPLIVNPSPWSGFVTRQDDRIFHIGHQLLGLVRRAWSVVRTHRYSYMRSKSHCL